MVEVKFRSKVGVVLLVGICQFFCLLTPGSVLGQYGGGTGEVGTPWEIGTAAHWVTLMGNSAHWGRNFILIADPNLAGVPLTPVGNSSIRFTGVLDGQGHVIRNAVINQPGSDYVGLFGYLGSGGQIKNLGVEDVDITGLYYVGGLVGGNDGTITFCYATGAVTGIYYVGGLAGYNDYGTITSCYAMGAVTGDDDVGGLVGYNDYGTITSCYATGAVTGISYYIGGLVGENYGTITSCYAAGAVTGYVYVGGDRKSTRLNSSHR